MSRMLGKLITNGQKLEFKVDGPKETQAANNIKPTALKPEAKVALQELQLVNKLSTTDLVYNPSTKVAIESATIVNTLSA